MAQADIVWQAVHFDMLEAGWKPTMATYLNRAPKARFLEAMREAKGRGLHSSLIT